MIRRTLRAGLTLVGLTVVLGVYLLVPVGRYTLYEHTLRILRTEPAQELGEDLVATGEELTDAARREWESRREVREEVSGTLRIGFSDDGGYRLGDERAELDEIRQRIHALRAAHAEIRAVIEDAETAPEETAAALRQLLRRERVAADWLGANVPLH